MSKKKRNKSRLTKVDLSAVLKLKEDYDNLIQDVSQLAMFILDFEQMGVVRRNLKSSDPHISLCYEEIYNAITEGRYSPTLNKPGWRDKFGEYERIVDHHYENIK
jgi:hypothetical protein